MSAEPTPPPQPLISVGAMIVGLVLMAVGNWYQVAVPTTAVWTDQQAEVYQKASTRLHSASFGAGHSHDKDHGHSHDAGDVSKSKEYIEAKAEFERIQGDLDRSRTRQSWIKYAIIGLGVVIASSGVIIAGINKLYAWGAEKSHGKAAKHGKDHKPQKYYHP